MWFSHRKINQYLGSKASLLQFIANPLCCFCLRSHSCIRQDEKWISSRVATKGDTIKMTRKPVQFSLFNHYFKFQCNEENQLDTIKQFYALLPKSCNVLSQLNFIDANFVATSIASFMCDASVPWNQSFRAHINGQYEMVLCQIINRGTIYI